MTHDQEEVLILADRVAVMEGGRIRQVASAQQDMTGIPVTTTALAAIDKLHARGVSRIAPLAQGDREETGAIAAHSRGRG